MTVEALRDLAVAERARQAAFRRRVLCCTSSGCAACGGEATYRAFAAELERQGLAATTELVPTGCMGLCGRGPLVTVQPDEVLYQQVDPALAAAIVTGHVAGGTPVAHAVVDTTVPFFASQVRIVNENSGRIDATRIEGYLAAGGYQALAKVLGGMEPGQVVEEVRASGLRGRGGAGYPTGLKWAITRKTAADQKYVVCNADEGDPGAFMDRGVLESDPHRVLEGMAIAGYAVGARQGYIYVRAEYPLAIERLRGAVRQAERLGLLGNRVLESEFSFRIDIRVGAGAFVCGEETALLRSIEGRRGRPQPRPPYPAEAGLFGKPTVINNVETFANIAPIINRGGAWFAGIGTPKSTGTKVFALTGQIRNNGLIEVPMGIPLRTIVFDIGGGTPEGTTFKAAQTGGPSGGCIPAEHLDLPVDYESLQAVGSIMGSGGLVVLDSTCSMVDIARYFMEFCMDESCGKCIPCRVGTVQLHGLLAKLVRREATAADLALLEELCVMVKETSLCGLGQAAPNPVLSTLRFFRDEYLAALVPAGEG